MNATASAFVTFDPEASHELPYSTLVEQYLGGIGRLVFPDGTVQFADNATYPDVVYSPRMTELELEAFCREHLGKYEIFFAEHQVTMIDHDKRPPIERFWEARSEP